MIGIHTKWTGIKEVDAALRAMPDQLREKYLKKACENVVNRIVRPKVLADVPLGKSGNLRTGVKAKPIRVTRKTRGISIGWQVFVGPPGFHASLIELGTRERFSKKSGGSRGAIEKPSRFAFLRRNLYGSESQSVAAFVKVMKAFITAQNMKLSTANKALQS